ARDRRPHELHQPPPVGAVVAGGRLDERAEAAALAGPDEPAVHEVHRPLLDRPYREVDAELGEGLRERVVHRDQERARRELEAVDVARAPAAADLLEALDEGDAPAGGGEPRGGAEPTDAGAGDERGAGAGHRAYPRTAFIACACQPKLGPRRPRSVRNETFQSTACSSPASPSAFSSAATSSGEPCRIASPTSSGGIRSQMRRIVSRS